MNDYYYKIIRSFIKLKDMQILNNMDTWILCKKKFYKNKFLNINILIHMGCPCFRYCVCKILSKDDFIEFYEFNFSKIT